MTNKAVFLDRDGVINDDTGHYYVYRPQDVKINQGITEGLKMLLNAGFRLFIVSNQGGVAKGLYTFEDVEQTNDRIVSVLKEEKIVFDDIYFCPHHESVSDCECRKPKPGMILKAMEEHDIDPASSFLIGDSERDIEAGNRAGLKQSFRIEKNSSIVPVCENIIEYSDDEK